MATGASDLRALRNNKLPWKRRPNTNRRARVYTEGQKKQEVANLRKGHLIPAKEEAEGKPMIRSSACWKELTKSPAEVHQKSGPTCNSCVASATTVFDFAAAVCPRSNTLEKYTSAERSCRVLKVQSVPVGATIDILLVFLCATQAAIRDSTVCEYVCVF